MLEDSRMRGFKGSSENLLSIVVDPETLDLWNPSQGKKNLTEGEGFPHFPEDDK